MSKKEADLEQKWGKKSVKGRLNMASGGTKNGQKLPKIGVTLVTPFLKK